MLLYNPLQYARCVPIVKGLKHRMNAVSQQMSGWFGLNVLKFRYCKKKTIEKISIRILKRLFLDSS